MSPAPTAMNETHPDRTAHVSPAPPASTAAEARPLRTSVARTAKIVRASAPFMGIWSRLARSELIRRCPLARAEFYGPKQVGDATGRIYPYAHAVYGADGARTAGQALRLVEEGVKFRGHPRPYRYGLDP